MDSALCRAKRRTLRVSVAALILLALLCLFFFIFGSDTKQKLPHGLKLVSDDIDLGTLGSSSSATGSFEIINDGELTYRVEKVVPECGCTVINLSERKLSPGRKLSIPVTISGSAWGEGRRTKRVAVYLSDEKNGNRSDLLFRVTANVEAVPRLSIIPARVRLGALRPGESTSIHLFARGEKY
jgi:hypothetical protein